MSSGSADQLYDGFYFARSCGDLPYRRDELWLGFFGRIADRLIDEIAPRTALDAGCAMGFLVEALRDRGVDAYGIDVSAFALEQVRPDIGEYVAERSITEPLQRDFDLIICIEVLEHLSPDDGQSALDNICAHTTELVFSSTPNDFAEATHLNVQPPEYWAAELARRGFIRDLDFDGSSITPWAARFRKQQPSQHRLIGAYERRLWRAVEETFSLRRAVAQREDELRRSTDRLESVRHEAAAARAATATADARAATAEAQAAAAEARERVALSALRDLTQTRTFRYTAPARGAYASLRRLRTRMLRRGGPAFVYAEDVDSAMTWDECRRLAELAAGKRVLEIGSWFGRSAIAMGSVAEHVEAIDLHDKGPDDQRHTLAPMLDNLARHGVQNKVRVHAGSSHEIVPKLPERAFDLILIDADHRLDEVLADLTVVLPHLKPGGYVAFHDYGEPGAWHRGEWDTWGVTEVADAFAEQVGARVEVVDTLATIRVGEPPERPVDPRSGAGQTAESPSKGRSD